MGMNMASRGFRVVMLDADLGGANLHSFLGIRRPRCSLTDFFDRKTPLNELVVDSGIEGLGLIMGDLDSLESESIKYTQKLKLLRHIRALEADFVLIDLGGGSSSNTLDMFIAADRMLVITVPEITSIENLYHFIKNVFFRKMKMGLGKGVERDTVMNTWRERDSCGIRNLKGLVDYLMENYPRMSDVLERELSGFTIDIVTNRIRGNREISVGNSICSVFRKYLGFNSRYAGYIEHDDAIWRCTNRGKAFMLTYPSSNCAREIGRLVDNLLDGMHVR
jgi:flagellar biosynthesis protein FlhG